MIDGLAPGFDRLLPVHPPATGSRVSTKEKRLSAGNPLKGIPGGMVHSRAHYTNPRTLPGHGRGGANADKTCGDWHSGMKSGEISEPPDCDLCEDDRAATCGDASQPEPPSVLSPLQPSVVVNSRTFLANPNRHPAKKARGPSLVRLPHVAGQHAPDVAVQLPPDVAELPVHETSGHARAGVHAPTSSWGSMALSSQSRSQTRVVRRSTYTRLVYISMQTSRLQQKYSQLELYTFT